MARRSTRRPVTIIRRRRRICLIPRTVVIAAGGQVEFEIDPFHRVNVYRAGTGSGRH